MRFLTKPTKQEATAFVESGQLEGLTWQDILRIAEEFDSEPETLFWYAQTFQGVGRPMPSYRSLRRNWRSVVRSSSH
jgi:hypothetical protein